MAEVEHRTFNDTDWKLSTEDFLGIYLAYSSGAGVPSVAMRRISVCNGQHPPFASYVVYGGKLPMPPPRG